MLSLPLPLPLKFQIALPLPLPLPCSNYRFRPLPLPLPLLHLYFLPVNLASLTSSLNSSGYTPLRCTDTSVVLDGFNPGEGTQPMHGSAATTGPGCVRIQRMDSTFARKA